MPANSLRRRFVKGAFWSVAATIIAQGLGLAASIVAARILGKTVFGELGMIQSTVGMFGTLAGLGLGLTATKHVAEFRNSDPLRAGRIIGMSSVLSLISGGLISVIIFLISPYLAEHTISAPRLTGELRIGCGLLFFNTLVGVQIGVLSGFEAFKTVAKVSLFRGLLNLPLVVLGVYFWGLPGAISGMVCAVAGGWVINCIAVRKETHRAHIPVSCHNIRSELPVLWAFSLPTFLSVAMISPVMWGANALLANQAGGYAALGIFTAATRFQSILNLAGTKVGAALLPMLASRDAAQSDRFNRANILISWLLGVIPALPLICFPEIMGLLFGPQYADISARRTLVLVMCYTCIILYKQGLARVLVAHSLMWWGLLSNTMWAIVLMGSFWFLKQFGAIGLASAFVTAYMLNTICFIPLYTRRGLVPKGTIISSESATIWIVITGLTLLSIFQFPLLVRGISIFVSILPLFIAFRRLFRGSRE
ncbi:MAG: oligosaccharide flippase family protein [Planctomycetota bacterium]